ncbi:MAG: GTPase ObgE [Desulfobulbaceae bacterium]|nr:MAG: GTPase ObgE [Desulfobulbaceae bacterium]
MSFIDEVKFYIKAGDGGNGCVSFRREKYVPKGGPNGGDGGKGGNVIITATNAKQSLLDFKYRSHFKAERGMHGKGKDMHGRKGNDCIVEVPVGSVIKDAETNEEIIDLTVDGQQYLAAKGGQGGLGNAHFATGANRTPRYATDGKPGDEKWLRIELKLIADIGLVGLPNAGKSSLLSQLSSANPKIAPYPFTTLEPQLGVLQLKHQRPYIIADIPGLIEGAHDGVGLGHSFLKHIERTSIILHVIDVSDDNYESNFSIIEDELRKYKAELSDRIKLVVFNKIDMVDSDMVAEFASDFQQKAIQTVPVSALTGEGIDQLKDIVARTMDDLSDSIL